jgi:hypothetical protein
MTITSTFSLSTVKPEFTANSFTAGPQMLPDAHRLNGGGYVVAYNNQDSGDGYILVDFYDANSNRTNSHVIAPYDTLANTSAFGAPSVTQLENGNVLVVWNNVDPANRGVKAAIFTPTGQKIGTEKALTLGSGQLSDPHVEALPGGGFVLSFEYDDFGGQIWARVFDANGDDADPNSIIGTLDVTPGHADYYSTCAVLATGNIVVAWSSDPSGPADAQLHARILDSEGNPITDELTLDSVGGNYVPAIAALPNGNWAVAYGDTGWGDENGSTGISLKILTPAGTNALFGASTIHVNTPHPQADTRPALTVLDNGFILVTWNTEVSPSSFDVYGRVFTQSGNPVTINGISGELLISSAAGNDTFPDAAALAAGRFLTSWTSADNGGQEIAATVHELFRTTAGDGADDTITGDALRDIISGGGGNDAIDAGAGNDTIAGGAGYNRIDGGIGDDTAVFSHSFDQYRASDYNGLIFVHGPDSDDRLVNVEHLQFADVTFDVVDDGIALFDTLYYLSRNPDVFQAGVNAFDHFNAAGWHEGRNPNGFFDTSGYLANNPDVAASGMNPLEHYHQSGWREGRDPNDNFDTTLYLINNPDVAAAGVDPLAHFLQSGFAEGRPAYEAIGSSIVNGFDAQYYLFHSPDVAAAGIDPLFHFSAVGWHEGRNPNDWFDTAGYLAHYTDVAAAGINPLDHYMAVGWHEGRDASMRFDTLGYLAENPDVAAAHVNPLQHFLQFGIYEGREAIYDGMWH